MAMGYWAKKVNKYNAKKTTCNGIIFDSKKEAERYTELAFLQRQGVIKDLQRQVPFELQASFKKGKRTYRAITYYADFVYTDTQTRRTIVEDTKGYRTEVYNIKKKLFEFKYPKLTIKEL